jgi:hypothetical protein
MGARVARREHAVPGTGPFRRHRAARTLARGGGRVLVPDDDDAKASIRTTFQLGWALAELRGRILTSEVSRKLKSLSGTEQLSEMLWRGSQWRISFDSASQLHEGTGYGDDLMNSRYDPGAKVPNLRMPNLPRVV